MIRRWRARRKMRWAVRLIREAHKAGAEIEIHCEGLLGATAIGQRLYPFAKTAIPPLSKEALVLFHQAGLHEADDDA